MARVIGTGVSALEEFVAKCKGIGGTPVIRTKVRGKPLVNAVVVACRGARGALKGGTVLNVPADVALKYRAPRRMRII